VIQVLLALRDQKDLPDRGERKEIRGKRENPAR